MAVHVEELHTDIRPADPPPGREPQEPLAGRTTQDLWEEARCRAEWVARRTAATGFDD